MRSPGGSIRTEVFLKAHSDFCGEKYRKGEKGGRRYISTKADIEFQRYDSGLEVGGKGEGEEWVAGRKYVLTLWMTCFFVCLFFTASSILSKQFEGKAPSL